MSYDDDYDIDVLYENASRYMSSLSKEKVNWLHRDKSPSYFNALRNSTMTPRLKDQGGHRKNPINGNLMGVFFAAKQNLNDISIYGTKRYYVPIKDIITKSCNMYFTDFYCFNKKGPHYTILVVTQKNSQDDRKCQMLGLPPLDVYNNPFLSRNNDSTFLLPKSRAGHRNFVEVFYCDQVKIKLSLYSGFKQVKNTGTGTIIGKPCNTLCKICTASRMSTNYTANYKLIKDPHQEQRKDNSWLRVLCCCWCW